MSRLGVLGGTFDPIHNGHLYIAENAKLFCDLDKVIFMPSAQSPHKLENKITQANHRYNMCNLAIKGEKDFIVSDYEISKDEISYTFNTLTYLQKENKGSKIHFILGADMLKDFKTWYRAHDIIKEVELIALARPNFNLNEIIKQDFFVPFDQKITLIDLNPVNLAASNIRKQFAMGLSIKHLVPESVYEYIELNKLYKEAN